MGCKSSPGSHGTSAKTLDASLAASKEFDCVKSSRPSLLTVKSFHWLFPVGFEYNLRSVSVHGAWGESISTLQGSQLFIFEQARGEIGFFVAGLRRNSVGSFQTSGSNRRRTCVKHNHILQTAANRA